MCNVGQEVEELQRGSAATVPTLESVKAELRALLAQVPDKLYSDRRDICVNHIGNRYSYAEMCAFLPEIPLDTAVCKGIWINEGTPIITVLYRFIGIYLYSEIIEEETD